MNNFKQFAVNEGLFDRAKAGMVGAKQSIGNVARGAMGKTQSPDQFKTGGVARSQSIDKTFQTKITKEVTNFKTKLQKALGVTSPDQIVAALEQIDPKLSAQYTSIEQSVSSSGSPQAQAPQAQAPQAQVPQAQAPQAQAPQAQAGGSKISSFKSRFDSGELDKQQILDYIKSKKAAQA